MPKRLMRKQTLPTCSFFKTNEGTAEEKSPPKIIHYVRVGTEPLEASHLYQMMVTSQLHQEKSSYKLMLWVEPRFFSPEDTSSEMKQLRHLVNNYGYEAHPFTELAMYSEEIAELISWAATDTTHEKECEHKIPVCAADAIRLAVLFVHGGIYMDSDVALAKAWPATGLSYEYGFSVDTGMFPGDFCNSVMISTPKHQILQLSILKIINNYMEMSNEWALEESDRLGDFVLKKTGPKVITDAIYKYRSKHQLPSTDPFIIQMNDKALGVFKHHFDNTWTPCKRRTDLESRNKAACELIALCDQGRKKPLPTVTVEQIKEHWTSKQGVKPECSVM